MLKIRISAVLTMVAWLAFASPVDDETALRVEQQVVSNKKLLNEAAKVFHKQTGYKELEKQIDEALPETGKRIQEGRTSVYNLRMAVVQIDNEKPHDRYALSDLYDGRRSTKKELQEHDKEVLKKKIEHEAALVGLTAEKVRRVKADWEKDLKKYTADRGQIVARLRVYQDAIGDRLKLLGKPAPELDAKADALEARLATLEDQFESTENGLNAYRAKVQAISRNRDAGGAIRTGTSHR
jgi:hypothetical protein